MLLRLPVCISPCRVMLSRNQCARQTVVTSEHFMLLDKRAECRTIHNECLMKHGIKTLRTSVVGDLYDG